MVRAVVVHGIGAWRLSLVVIMLLGWSIPGQAQNRVGRPGLMDPSQANPLLQLQQSVLEASFEPGLVALEGAIDPEEYIVGPGDQFSVSAGGALAMQQVVPISTDGNLTLPEVGSILAAGRTLADVQAEAQKALQSRFQNVPVQINLVQPRLFYVHILGAVPEPGRYLMLPVSRVDDAVQQAYASRAIAQPDPQADGARRIIGSATSERPLMNNAYRPSLRNVRITRSDGTEKSIDLLRYYTTGNTDHNPYLLDGDVITVEPYHMSRDAIRVSGEVPYHGIYDLRPDDTLLDILTLAAGPNGLDDLGDVRFTRRLSSGETESTRYSVQELRSEKVAAIPLEPGDFINVLPHSFAEASVQGMVEYPGTYQIEDGVTTLREIVEMAGGLKEDASLRGAFIERSQSEAFKEDARVSDLDFFSRAYALRSIHADRLIVDIAASLEPGGTEIVLKSNDRIVFPRNEEMVFVMGNVPNPGYIEYVEGMTVQYYIERAGGEGPLTKGIYVFEEGSGSMQEGNQVVVRSGDTIFVDREDIAETPEMAQLLITQETSRRQSRIMTTQTIITGVTALASVVSAFVALRSISK